MTTLSDSQRARQPKGSPTGGQYAPMDRPEADLDLDMGQTIPAETAFTRRYDTVEEKIEAFQEELNAHVANLDHDLFGSCGPLP